jgi:hypothetical protein
MADTTGGKEYCIKLYIGRMCLAGAAQLRRGSGGQALIVMALALVVLVAASGLATDVGIGLVERRRAQNAADAAVMAGLQVVVQSQTALGTSTGTNAMVADVMDRVAAANGATIDWTIQPPRYFDAQGTDLGPVTRDATLIPPTAAGMVLRAWRPFTPHFGAVLGFRQQTAYARTKAVVFNAGAPGKMRFLMPIGVPLAEANACYTTAQPCNLWDPSYAIIYGMSPGNQLKGGLDFRTGSGDGYQAPANPPETCSNDNDCLRSWTTEGWRGTLADDNIVQFFNGDHGQNIADGLREYVLKQGLYDAGGQYGIIYVPLWDEYYPATRSIKIAGFAAFKIYYNDIKSSSLVGTFVNVVSPATEIIPATPGWPYKTIRLVSLNAPPSAWGLATPTLVPTNTPVPATPTITPTPTATPDPAVTPTPTPAPTNCYDTNAQIQITSPLPGKTGYKYVIRTTDTAQIMVSWTVASNTKSRLNVTIFEGQPLTGYLNPTTVVPSSVNGYPGVAHADSGNAQVTNIQTSTSNVPPGYYTIYFWNDDNGGQVISVLTEVRYRAYTCPSN